MRKGPGCFALAVCLVLLNSVSVGIAANTPKDTAFEAIDRNKDEIAKVGDSIFYFAEMGMQEVETSKLCAQALRSMGYKVETGISGFPTAILATYGSGRPVIAVHTEYDAVPSGSQMAGVTGARKEIVPGAPGHAEGHNTNAAAMLGAAFAVKEAIDKHKLPGTVKFFTAPAEEQLVSRPFFVRDGYFKDADVSFHPHVGSDMATSYGLKQYALVSAEYEFFGKTAHSAVAPWTGISAVDAVKLMDIGWDVLREPLPPTQRSHSVIVNGGIQPNVVPDYAKIWFYFRESTYEGANNLYTKAKNVAQGAALMTGCTWKENVMSACWPTMSNQTMAEVVQSNIELVGMPAWTAEEQALARAIQKTAGGKEVGLATKIGDLRKATQGTSSNDSGDITWTVPEGAIPVPANVSDVPGHHWAASIAEATSIAHKGEVAGAKVLAGSMIDVLTKPEIVVSARETFKKEIGGTTYKPLLPMDQKPPLTLNEQEMAKYRDQMKKFYLNVPIGFK
jgi:aminobenzoyl-glutamate utilization protein B